MWASGGSVPGRENDQCKGPEVGIFLACSATIQASIAGAGLMRGGVVGGEVREVTGVH